MSVYEAIRDRRGDLASESATANRSAALIMGAVGDDIDFLIAECERMRALLTRVMWQKDREDKPRYCVACGRRREHTETCELAALLGADIKGPSCPHCDEHVAMPVTLAMWPGQAYVCPAIPEGTILLVQEPPR